MARLRSISPLSAVGWIVLGVVALGIPLVTDTFTTYQFSLVSIYLVALIGLNLLTGYSGQISLGNGAFMAFGGYTAGLLIKDLHWPYLLVIPLGGLVAGVFGFLFGIPALRLSGIYLALATFALALAVPPVINNYEGFTYGNGGVILRSLKAPTWLSGVFSNEQYQYYLMLIFAFVLFLFARSLIRSRTGRAFMAIRESETAAAANGVDLAYYKTLAFGLSAFYAGVSGALLVVLTAFAHPDTFGFSLSISLLVGLVVGGIGSDLGAVFGGLVVVWLPYFAEKLGTTLKVGSLHIGKPDIIYGLALILIVFFAPSGIAGLLQRAAARYGALRGGGREVVPDVLDYATGTDAVPAEPSEIGG